MIVLIPFNTFFTTVPFPFSDFTVNNVLFSSSPRSASSLSSSFCATNTRNKYHANAWHTQYIDLNCPRSVNVPWVGSQPSQSGLPSVASTGCQLNPPPGLLHLHIT